MGIVIGMDEAGYGPNLGPLVITATVWEVPGDPREFDFWSSLADVVSQDRPKKGDDRLHVADSKAVHSPAKGIGALERSIQPLLNLAGAPTTSFQTLAHWLIGLDAADIETSPLALPREPWFDEGDLSLPVTNTVPSPLRGEGARRAGEGQADPQTTAPSSGLRPPSPPVGEKERVAAGSQVADAAHNCPLTDRLQSTCQQAGLKFVAACSEIVLTQRFNRLTAEYDSKGVALSKTTFGLLDHVWDTNSDDPTLIIGDKHGGRNRYDDLIDELLDGQMIFRLRESREKSSYRVGAAELHFQTGAEAHFPVAVASMICKYVRELAMEQFNAFWRRHLPNLKPTKGYPTDAKRFRSDIAEKQRELDISDDILWRNR